MSAAREHNYVCNPTRWKSSDSPRYNSARSFGNSVQTAISLPPHVLALDDDPSIRELVTEYLTEN